MKRAGHPLNIYVYANDDAYAGAIASRDGIGREEHRRLVESIAQRLAAEGYDIEICEIS